MIEKRTMKEKKSGKKKTKIIYKEVDNPIEWLRRTYWCIYKNFKSTFIIDPLDETIDLGPGDLDCFEYLKHKCDALYSLFNKPGYEDRYFCFHK